MTKETAIDILESQKNEHYKEEINEALDMAISALKGGWIPVKGLDDVPKNGTIWITLKRPYVSSMNKPEGKRCPFRVIKTRRGLLTRTETTSFKKCLGDRCPYFNKYSIFCEKARKEWSIR